MVVTINGKRFGFRQKRAETPPPLPKLSPAIDINTSSMADLHDGVLKRCLRGWRGWAISAGLHGLLVLVLALLLVGRTVDLPGVVLVGEPATEIMDLGDFAISNLAPPERVANSAAPKSVSFDAPTSSPESLTREVPDALAGLDFSKGSQGGPIGDVLGLFGPGGHGMGEVATQEGTEFFGVRAAGNHFVFVVDISKSMVGQRWRCARDELLNTVEQLKPHQSFYVVFFDGAPHPMFSDRQPELKLAKATPDNKKRLKMWMRKVSFGMVTDPLGSVQLAVSLKPDAIFLLSDGEFKHHTADFLRRENRVEKERGQWQVETAVHTIGFQSQEGQSSLQQIAAENSGQYRFVP